MRCSTRWPSSSRARRSGRSRAAACSSGRRCPSSSTPATCSRRRCARSASRSCPASAAYVDGRGGSSMRLNFSGADVDEHRRRRAPHRQGGRRADRAVLDLRRERRQIVRKQEPDGSLTKRRLRAEPLADVVRAAAARATSGARRARDTAARRRAEGRAVARAPGVAALRGARRGRARAARHRATSRSTSAATLVDDLRASRRRRRVRRAARPRRRGRHGPGAAGDRRHALHRIRRARHACAAWTRC